MTTDQLDFAFAVAAAEAERDLAYQSMDDADKGRWETSVILRAIEHVAGQGEPFSSNDVREVLTDNVNTARIGRCFALASQRGLIESVGRVKSTKRNTHGKRVELWRAKS